MVKLDVFNANCTIAHLTMLQHAVNANSHQFVRLSVPLVSHT